MQIAERTLNDLGFAEIARALAMRCRTEPGKSRALSLRFLSGEDEVRASLSRTEEARWLAKEEFSLPLGGVVDARSWLERSAKGAALEPRELISIAQLLFSFERVREALEDRAEQVPGLAAIGARLPSLEPLAAKIDRCFEPSGEISDSASPALKEARARARSLHRSIKARIETLLRDEKFLANLQEPYFSIRGGRYVLPILAANRAQVPGIVHNASQSGQTLFVEPDALIGQGNDLAIADSVVLDEERRILLELSNAVGRAADRIIEGQDAAAELDAIEAAARLAADLGASAPVVDPDQGALDLIDLRHPLLLLRGKEVVANDLAVSREVRSIVISGPNAGGKTATLTAVGLCALMLRAGLQIPARGSSRVPLYSSVHSVIGDTQDLSHDLSTFSAHVEQLREIGKAAGPGSLVLIDEIAADTNPREGAALAIAVLEDLIARGATVLVTTHLEEVKALAHLDHRFMNARVGFDPDRLAPTYKLQLGMAGTSSAIEIAARVGLPAAICQRARELAMGTAGSFSKALTELEEERRRLSQESEKARSTALEAQQARSALEAERLELERRRRIEDLEHRQRLKAELDRAAAEIREMLVAIRAERSLDAATRAQTEVGAKLNEVEQRIQQDRDQLGASERREAPAEVKVGSWVWHPSLDADVEVVDVIGDEAVIAAGALKMRVPVSQLRASRGKRPKPRFSAQAKAEGAIHKAEQAAPATWAGSQRRCDVRGLRLEDALREVDRFLDRLLRSGEDGAVIVHGHGTGARKQGIRDLLASSPYVRLYRPGESHEGGDGVTIVAVRQ